MALGAPVVAVGVSVAIAVQQWGDVVVLAASIVVVTVSAWYALTRRGVLRVVAAAVAIIAATAVITVGLRLLLVQIALLLVFAVAGRYALGPDAQASRGARTPLAPDTSDGMNAMSDGPHYTWWFRAPRSTS